MSITQEITALPDAPERSDPDNFADKSDAFLAGMEDMPDELNTWATQANNLATEMEGLKDDAETAKTGAETAQTGAEAAQTVAVAAKVSALASANATVYSSGVIYSTGEVVLDPAANYWTFISKTSSNTGNMPHSDDGTNWQRFIDGTRAGATEETSAAGVVLTSESDFVQWIKITSPLQTVTLPDATTMDEGIAFIIRPLLYDFFIADDEGATLCATDREDVILILLDNSSAAGKWRVMYDSGKVSLLVGDTTVYANEAVHRSGIVALSATKALLCYNNSLYHGVARVIDISDGYEISVGSPFEFASSGYGAPCLCALSETTVVSFYQSTASGDWAPTAIVLSISGTTITAGSPVTVNSLYPANSSAMCVLTSSSVAVAYNKQAAPQHGFLNVLSISGTTITVGATTEHTAASSCYDMALAPLSATTALFGYTNSSAEALIVSVSGSNITLGTPMVFNTGRAYGLSAAVISTGKIMVCYADYANSYWGTAQVLTVSGSTITAGGKTVFNSASTSRPIVARVSDAQCLVVYSGGVAKLLHVEGDSTIKAGVAMEYASGDVGYHGMDVLFGTVALVNYADADNSGYGTVCCIKGA